MIVISQVNKKNKKKANKFATMEWKKFNKERGYIYKEKKIELVAKDNNDIIGYVNFNLTGGSAYFSEMIVKKGARAKGIGKMLLAKFEEIAKKNKCHVAYLQTTEKHKEALFLYKKNGYKIIAEVPDMMFHFKVYYLIKRLSK